MSKQLLIDISDVARKDRRTGIQRVARALLQAFLVNKPPGYQIEPIYLDDRHVYRYARRYLFTEHGIGSQHISDQCVETSSGDIYLGVDLYTSCATELAPIYDDWRANGVLVAQVIYDLLPISHPEWFLLEVSREFRDWLEIVATHTDHLLAISRTVASDIESWLQHQGGTETNRPIVSWFHLGADIAASLPSNGFEHNAPDILEAIAESPSFLMVATIEPRKGHAQVLAAFEQLWAQGVQINLVLVGKQGWLVERLVERVRNHPQLGKRLFWLAGISDQYLEAVYPRCVALLAASEGEGFGLPIVEAARHGIPVLARDIAVFREVGSQGATYFQADTPDALARHINSWLELAPANRAKSAQIKQLTWHQSARQIWQSLAPGRPIRADKNRAPKNVCTSHQ